MTTQTIVKRTRWYRKIHRWLGSGLFIFFFIISGTGLLLGWKKNSNGYLLAKTYQGTSTDVKQWLPVDSLQNIAVKIIHDSISADLSGNVDRIDARPGKGMVKFVFTDHYWAVQLDCTTGKLLHIEKRRADFIEQTVDFVYANNEEPTHLTVVFTSSKDGDYWTGAVGSTLIVNDLELIYPD